MNSWEMQEIKTLRAEVDYLKKEVERMRKQFIAVTLENDELKHNFENHSHIGNPTIRY